jgi:hypothetical protein
MVLSATVINISAISWLSVVLVQETGEHCFQWVICKTNIADLPRASVVVMILIA